MMSDGALRRAVRQAVLDATEDGTRVCSAQATTDHVLRALNSATAQLVTIPEVEALPNGWYLIEGVHYRPLAGGSIEGRMQEVRRKLALIRYLEAHPDVSPSVDREATEAPYCQDHAP